MSSSSQRGALPNKSRGGVTVPDGGGPPWEEAAHKKKSADPGSLCRDRLSLHFRG